MHEMPFTQALLEMAFKEAGDSPIRTIYLRAGALSAIVPASVEYFFDYLSKGTLAEGAALVFETVPITLTCQSCGKDTEVTVPEGSHPRQALSAAFTSGCPCGQTHFKVTGGLDFDMTGIEV